MKKGVKNILIIDDDPDVCMVAKIMLEKEGYKVKAIGRFEPLNHNNIPDLILLDIALPGQDGRKICRQLKNDTATRLIPIIMFSASPNTKRAALDAGADDSLEKPFQMNELIEKIKNFPKIPHSGEKIPHQV